MQIGIDQQIRFMREEIKRVESLFPVLVGNGRLSIEKATSDVATMRQIYQTLSQLKGLTSS
jgi:hypothetical protein